MDHKHKLNLKSISLIFALLLVSACSSSKVDEGSAPETALGADGSSEAGVPAEAATDAAPPSADATAAAPEPAVVSAPVADISAAPVAPPQDPGGFTGTANAAAAPEAPPITDAPPAPVAEAPVAEAPAVEAPAVDSAPGALAASSNPPAPPANLDSAPVSGEVKQIRVKRGDTLMKIAFENYGDLYRWKEILDSNRAAIPDPNHLTAGTTLNLSGAGMVTIERNGEAYLIKTGDTLGLISNEVYGTKAKWKKLWENNRQLIKDPNRIYAGFNLYYVPEARMTQEGSPASNQSLPFKNQADPAQVANGPAPSEPARTPASAK